MAAGSANTILVINGPNLNLLGRREPEIYGTEALDDIEARLTKLAKAYDLAIDWRQSNHEGALIDWLHEAMDRCAAVIINPGGLTHSSVSLADAVRACALPAIEVHLSNIHAREPFRRHSYIAPACLGSVSGLGAQGYELALLALARHLEAT